MTSSPSESFPNGEAPLEPVDESNRLLAEVSALNQRTISLGSMDRDDLVELIQEATQLLIRQNENIRDLSVHFNQTLARLNLEMSQVRDVQESLLPDHPPQIEGVDFACEYLPSGHASGDYYDFLTPTEDQVGVFIADVSGHGAPSAVVMAITRVLVQEHLRSIRSAGEALSKVNSLMHRFVPGSLYVTGAYLLYDHRTHRFRYATAGHPAPILWKESEKRAQPLEIIPRFPLKFLPDVTYETLESSLDPGDVLIFYTDGITELTDGEGSMVGQEKLLDWIGKSPKATSAGLLWGLLDFASRHTGGVPPEDDFTVVVLKRTD